MQRPPPTNVIAASRARLAALESALDAAPASSTRPSLRAHASSSGSFAPSLVRHAPAPASTSTSTSTSLRASAQGTAGGPGARLTILAAMGRDVLGLWNNVLVTYWQDPPTLDRLRRVSEVQERVAESLPEGFVVLAILPTVPVRLHAVVRDEAERLVSRAPASLRAMAYVVGGTGFVAASVRSVALGVAMVLPHKLPMRVFGALEPAAGFLATFLDRELRASAPRLLVEAIRHGIP